MSTATAPAPAPLQTMRALKAAIRPGTVLTVTAHPVLPPHERKVTRTTTQGFYFTPSYGPGTHRLFFPWPLRGITTFHPGGFTVDYPQGPAVFWLPR